MTAADPRERGTINSEETTIVSAADDRIVTAQELYKAIRVELEKLHQFSGSSTNEIEKLARAYALVSETIGPNQC